MTKKFISVTSHALLPPPLSQTVTPSRTPSPSSVTYFMDGPWSVCQQSRFQLLTCQGFFSSFSFGKWLQLHHNGFLTLSKRWCFYHLCVPFILGLNRVNKICRVVGEYRVFEAVLPNTEYQYQVYDKM